MIGNMEVYDSEPLKFNASDLVVSIKRSGQPVAERALMLAIFEDGIRSLLQDGDPRRAIEAETWIVEGNCGPVTFNEVCEEFNIDPEAARRALMELKDDPAQVESVRKVIRQRLRAAVRRPVSMFKARQRA